MISNVYNNIGDVYRETKKYTLALKYYQKGITASLKNFDDTLNINTAPTIGANLNWSYLLNNIEAKAKIYATIPLKESNQKTALHTALIHYQAADTLINQTRREIAQKYDKLALGERTNIIYKNTVDVCFNLDKTTNFTNVSKYKKLAFQFSEKDKSSVLRASLAHTNALCFAGLPDSLIEKEQRLQIETARYKQQLAQYPDYYKMKYSTKNVSVEELQKKLDEKTAILSYLIGDSVNYIFRLTNKQIKTFKIPRKDNFDGLVKSFRCGIVSQIDRFYNKFGYELYKHLFPQDAIPANIENLIIIPDGILSTIPFEALLYDKNDNESYLIKKYNITYAYSANLWYQNRKSSDVEKFHKISLQQPQNGLLAIAPVFEDKNMSGVSLRTRSLLNNLDSLSVDSIHTRGRLVNGNYVSPLPGSEDEVKQLYNIFAANNRKAYIKTHGQAREEFLKSDTISKYKYIHIATHGFVNSEKPELSGILLAQDTNKTLPKFETMSKLNTEDGILYSGEIYNLNLNADLVTLSACETGLGQIKKGEGVIGLTRALMYAGAKNIAVSLWKASDESTSELMVDFYKNIIKQTSKKPKNVPIECTLSQALREAKLKMIGGKKYSHPFYWSPFVIIGE